MTIATIWHEQTQRSDELIISLPRQLERWVGERVRGGSYGSASEVVREALRLLCEREESKQLRLLAARQRIRASAAQLDRTAARAIEAPVAKRRPRPGQQRRGS